MKVKMHHPLTGHDIEVAESAIPFHATAGWELVEEEASPGEGGEPTEQQQADESQDQSDERKGAPSRSRRTKKEDES